MVVAQAVYNWKEPIFPEASSDALITNKKQFSNVIRVNAPLDKLGKGAVAVMKVNIPDFMIWGDMWNYLRIRCIQYWKLLTYISPNLYLNEFMDSSQVGRSCWHCCFVSQEIVRYIDYLSDINGYAQGKNLAVIVT